MKDLSLFYSIENDLIVGSSFKHCSFDNTARIMYFANDSNLYGVDMNSGEVTYTFDLISANCSNESDNRIINVQYLTEMNNIFLANEKGDLMVLNIMDSEVECVGCITDGLAAVDWSPDQELVVLISTANNMLLMSKDFNLISEKPLSNEEFGEAKFINVGWGKKETQFHGSEGKGAAKKVATLEGNRYDWDDLKPRVSWRTDAEFFLVHFIDETKNIRKFQVYNREGVLHSTSESIMALESAIVWKNSRTLITSATHRPNMHEIVFFERNGLAHGSFTLPFSPKEFKVNELSWNNDSSLLCVCCERIDPATNDELQSIIQLWSIGNYHWYLKYSANFSMKNKITAVSWDPEFPLGLHVLTATGKYIKYLFGWTTHSCNNVKDYNGSVAVIDGSDLLITSFKDAIIPPPLCAYKLHCSVPINNLVWSPTNLDILVYLMNGNLVYYKYKTEEILDSKSIEIVSARTFEPNKHRVHSFVAENKIETGHDSHIQHISWIDESTLAIVTTVKNQSKLTVYDMKIDEKTIKLNKKNEMNLTNSVLNTSFNPKSQTLGIQFTDGSIYKYSNGALNPWMANDSNFRFPQICPSFHICSLRNNVEKELCVGLTDFYRLYINNKEISNNCTSFFIHDKYLLFSTHTNTLKFIDLNKYDQLADDICIEESSRRLERGSKIVHCLHYDTNCIFQMPRGNLESVHPRALIITKIKEDIDALKYKDAIELMRKHRINMNILYDHNPQHFMDKLQLFIEQIDNVNLMNLFVTELKYCQHLFICIANDDTTRGLYGNMYEERKKDNEAKNENKVNSICEKMIELLSKTNEIRYFLVILSCCAKKDNLDDALQRIMKYKSSHEALADDGLRHLLYLVNVNQLFDIALGTYDFNIVIMVAEKSQKDPKEYLPFLNELKKLEENYRKYKIDMHLKRYKKALASIVKCDESHNDEMIKLVNEQKLFSDALKHFKPGTNLYKEISQHFANYLANKKYYQEAGFILFRANLLEESLEPFAKSCDWKMYASVCSQLSLPPNEYRDKLQIILDILKDNNKHYEMALLSEQYLSDFESAIVSLINGSHWEDAIRLIHKYKRFDFLETNLLPSLKTSYDDVLSELKTHYNTFVNHKARLIQVRNEKKEKRLREDLENDDIPENDDTSQMSSVIDSKSTTNTVKSAATSINSQISGRTSRNKNKMKKKAISLKKGSANEDLAIIQEISDLITLIYNMQESIASLNHTLLKYHMDDCCFNIQTEYEKLLTTIDKSTNDIWDYLAEEKSQQNVFSTQQPLFNSEGITDYAKLDIKYRFPPQMSTKKFQWKLHIKEF